MILITILSLALLTYAVIPTQGSNVTNPIDDSAREYTTSNPIDDSAREYTTSNPIHDSVREYTTSSPKDDSVREYTTSSPKNESVPEVTIAAAMEYHDNLIALITDDNQVFVFNSRTGYHHYFENSTYFNGLPWDMKLTAVVKTFDPEHYKVLFYTAKYGLFMNYGKGYRQLKYGKKRKFLQNGGPDAAVRKGGQHYFFKGCMMSVRELWDKWTPAIDVTRLGLPCNIDAAWKQNDDAVILKGNLVWMWLRDGSVVGPKNFCIAYDCKGKVTLKPSSDNF